MNRNRTAGIKYEQDVVRELRDMGYDVHTARYESRRADDSGIDIVGNFPFNVQCKVSVNQPNVHRLLTERACDVVFYKKVEKAAKNFISKGEYVMLSKEDFYNLIAKSS